MQLNSSFSEGYSSAKYMQPATRKTMGVFMLVALGLCAVSASPIAALATTAALSCGLSAVQAAMEKKSGREIALAPVKALGFWAGLAVQTAKDIKNGISNLLSRGRSGSSHSFYAAPAADTSLSSKLGKVFRMKPAFTAAKAPKPAVEVQIVSQPAIKPPSA